MATINVSDFDGLEVALEKPLPPGRVGAASARPVVFSVEDKAAIDSLVTAAQAILAKFPAAAGAGGGLKIDGSGTALPVSGTVAVTGGGDASAANQTAGNASLSTIAGKDFATQVTAASILAKLIAAPATEAKQDNAITQETAAAAALGTTAGAAVITDANGTVQQYLRGLVKRWVDALGAGTAAAALRVTLATDGTIIGPTTETAALNPAATAGLNGILKGLWTSFIDLFGTSNTALAAIKAAAESTAPVAIIGDIAHDAVDTTFPIKIGAKAIAHGTSPTPVTAGDRTDLYASRAGIQFVIGGHPNVVCAAHIITDANGAQTDAALIPSIATGTKVVLTRLSVVCDNANSGDCAVTIGFGATTTPVPDLDGTNGVIVNGSFDGGAGVTIGDGSGIIGIGADGEELRFTCSDPVAGNIRISYSYYTAGS